jgi:hypothetical protein
VAQEQAGLHAEALDNLKFYLLAAPDAKNARDVKNKIYALEVLVEDIQAGKKAPAAVAAPTPPTAAAPTPAPAAAIPPGKPLAIAARPTLEIEASDKDLRVIKMPAAEKKALPNFVGAWHFKVSLRGEDVIIDAFEITKNAAGDFVVTPPKRSADNVVSVAKFEIKNRNLNLQMNWKMTSVAGYWKNELYELTLSEDGSTLTGTHNQKSVGGRNIYMDRVLFRQ